MVVNRSKMPQQVTKAPGKKKFKNYKEVRPILESSTKKMLDKYYKDLIKGKILRRLVVKAVEKNSFSNYMKNIGKLGGQNKVPRLSNDYKISSYLEKYVINKD